jgi:hypothetical protein
MAMGEIYQDNRSAGGTFIRDYFRTFARFLDPNLPPVSRANQREETQTWSWGQTVAFATIASVSLWIMVAAIIYYFT